LRRTGARPGCEMIKDRSKMLIRPTKEHLAKLNVINSLLLKKEAK
jgi:hypothetical protein